MRNTYSIQFYCRPCKATKNGLAPVELSIIINGKRSFVQLPRKEYPEVFKKSINSKRDNPIKEFIYEVRNKLNDIQLDMMKNNIPVTTQSLREYFKTGGVKSYLIRDMFDDYFSILSKRVGIDLTLGAYKKYQNARDCFYRFISPDKEAADLTPHLIESFLADCNTKYEQSTTCGIMTKIKTVIMYAKDNGKIQINPFSTVKYGKGKKDIEYLTEDEINTIKNKNITIDRLSKVRDLAIFQMSSGLSYIDTINLKKEDVHFTEDGTCYINKARHKTNVDYTAIVFPDGVEILKKYDYQLPNISNQKGNSYLKEIQDICGITKTLHFHLFRKTYATRLINRGVRLETVSKCLGHSNTTITQQTYSKLLNKTIIDEVKKVF